MKWWIRILLLLTLLLTGGALFVYFFVRASRPVYEGQKTVEGLAQPVEVMYDEYGVPHIYARQETDAYFALGYVHAQDRLFQMEMLRRAASGRLSEVLGRATLKVDVLFRTLQISAFARAQVSRFKADSLAPYHRAVRAYQEGINAYIREGETPPEFTLLGIPKSPFTLEDIYHAVGFMSFGFAEGLRTDPVLEKIARELGPTYLQDLNVLSATEAERIKSYRGAPRVSPDQLIGFLQEALSALPVPMWSGSNGWAISGDRTASGKPILANDTHIGFAQPAVWYEAYLEYPGFRFYGHHLAGIPFGLLGQNNFCAWGLTMFENDDTDFYYETEASLAAAERRTEIIRMKGEADTVLTVWVTPHGPVVNSVLDLMPAQPVSLWWALLQGDNESVQAAYELNHASTFEAAERAAARFSSPGLNIMYADQAGNIAWWAAARLPKRSPEVNSKLFLSADEQAPPSVYHPFSDNPQAINPPWGFVYSANNQPDTVGGVLFPGYYFPRSRAGRIRALLEEDKRWTLEDVKKMILDVVSDEHRAVAREVADVLSASSFDDAVTVASVLRNWNGDHTQEQVAPSVYYHMLTHILKYAMEDELGPQAYAIFRTTSEIKCSFPRLLRNDSSLWWDNIHTPARERRSLIFEKAALQTAALLRACCGKNPGEWQWRKIHTLTHAHALAAVRPLDRIFNVGPFPVDGGSEVINNLQFELDTVGYYPVKAGPALRKIVDLADPEHGITVSPTGQSGHLLSPHYKDQALLFATGQFRTMVWNQGELKNARTLQLRPQPR